MVGAICCRKCLLWVSFLTSWDCSYFIGKSVLDYYLPFNFTVMCILHITFVTLQKGGWGSLMYPLCLRAVIWFFFPISFLVFLPSPLALSVLLFFNNQLRLVASLRNECTEQNPPKNSLKTKFCPRVILKSLLYTLLTISVEMCYWSWLHFLKRVPLKYILCCWWHIIVTQYYLLICKQSFQGLVKTIKVKDVHGITVCNFNRSHWKIRTDYLNFDGQISYQEKHQCTLSHPLKKKCCK